MKEPDAYNYTPFACEVLPLLDTDGMECRVSIVKATYALRRKGSVALAEEQRPLRYGDEMWGAPEIPDVRFPGDLCVRKPGTDVLVIGEACAPRERPVPFTDVTIAVGKKKTILRAFGTRFWKRGLLGLKLSEPEPMVRVPLRWGLAFGGYDASDPAKPLEEPRNPVGRGIARDVSTLRDQPGPQIEDPRDLISSSSSRPAPIGCAPLGRHYEPRRSLAGTYDEQWLQKRYPARPADYKEQHENCAPPNFVFSAPIQGNEVVAITNMAPTGAIEFPIPRLRIEVEAVVGGKTIEQRPHPDTVVIDTSSRLIEVVWRASFPYPLRLRDRFDVIRVRMKEYL